MCETRTAVAVEDTAIDVVEHADTGEVSPNDPASEESPSQKGAVNCLVDAAGEIELVAEPVNIEEWRRELVEKEGGRVKVDEWSLESQMLDVYFSVEHAGERT